MVLWCRNHPSTGDPNRLKRIRYSDDHTHSRALMVALTLEETVKRTAIRLLELAATRLPEDVTAALRYAYEREDSEAARIQLDNMLRNIELANLSNLPMCQDTGLILFFNELGRGFPRDLDLDCILVEAVREATESIPLRPNTVHPITRTNTGDNVGIGIPQITWTPTDTDYLETTVLLKGAGSENMSRLRMLNPSSGVEGIKEFLVDTVVKSGGKPCPPTILGVGIGGTSDGAMKLAKKAILRPLDCNHPDPVFAELEETLLKAVNDTGIGAMGLGGKTTALGVHIEYAHCHLASLPVGINVQCYAARRSKARILKDGNVEMLSHKGEDLD